MRGHSLTCLAVAGLLAASGGIAWAQSRANQGAEENVRQSRQYEQAVCSAGLKISGRSPDGKFVEIAELPSHPWFLAVQFHPEFKSKPLHPHPLFASFVEASYRRKTAHAAPRAAASGA